MSTYSDIVDALKARLDSVTNIGITHARLRWNSDWTTYLDHFKTTISSVPQIRGAMVSMSPTDPIRGIPDAAPFGSIQRHYAAQVVMLLGLDDSEATERTFLNLVEAALDALDGRTDLGIAAVVDYSVGPASVTLYQIRQFGSVLVNYAEIAVPVEVTKALTYG